MKKKVKEKIKKEIVKIKTMKQGEKSESIICYNKSC